MGDTQHGARTAQGKRGGHHWRQGHSAHDACRTRTGNRCKKVLRRSDKWPLDRFSVIAPEWHGCTVTCIGGGPSLTREQCDAVAAAQAAGRTRVVAINDAYRLAPTADLLYFADARWWEWHKGREEFQAFKGEKVTIENTGHDVTDPQVHMLRNAATVPNGNKRQGDGELGGLSPWPTALRTGMNGGYQALGLAIAAGAARVVLLGYDMGFLPGKSHWFGEHPNHHPLQDDGDYSQVFRRFFEQLTLPHGVEVLNATPGSRIKAFPRVELAGVFA